MRLIAASLLVASVVHATTMMPLDTAQMVERSEHIVLATVESSVAQWSPDHQFIYTEVTLRVSRAYKGGAKAGQALLVRHEGGTVDGIGMRVYGAAEFQSGEEVVAFVEKRGEAHYIVGMAQGKLRVEKHADGLKYVAPDVSALHFVQAPSANLTRSRPLTDLEKDLTRLISARKAAPAKAGK